MRSAPLGPPANRLEVDHDRAAQGLRCKRVRRLTIECVQRKAGGGGVLRSVGDTCHGLRSTQNRKLAFLVLRTSDTTPSRQPHQSGRSHHCCRRSFRPGDVRLVVQRLRCFQQCRAVGDTARFVQWGSNLFLHVGPGSWRGATAHRRRALLPLFMTALEKISTLLLDVKHTRTQYDSLTTQGTYQRSRDRLSREWPTTLRRAGRTCTLFWRRFPTVERWSLFCDFRSFQGGGGGGVENETNVLRFASFRELLRRAPN